MQLILFDGLPGAGKSTLAEAVGRRLRIPVFTRDWLVATLYNCQIIREGKDGSEAGHDLMAVLALRQFQLGQSAILDCVHLNETRRGRWRVLAAEHGARLYAVECVCSDLALHRARLAGRQRGIPGWAELTWEQVEGVRARYEPWQGEALRVDTVRPLAENLPVVLAYLGPATFRSG